MTAVKNFAEYVAPGELKSVDELKPGQGAIVREGLTKVAAYRDEQGQIQRRSAACTHLGCHVHWNSLERCWDCPCHGSHFAVDGTALNAPAVAPLAPLSGETGSARKKASERVQPLCGIERAAIVKIEQSPTAARLPSLPLGRLPDPPPRVVNTGFERNFTSHRLVQGLLKCDFRGWRANRRRQCTR